jgi:hypothetical protein
MSEVAAIIAGMMLIAAYLALGIWAVRATWVWSSGMGTRWMRVACASTVATVLFMPGIVGAGHGIGIGPAWLMFATGTFSALTTASKLKALAGIAIGWLITLSIGFLVAGSNIRGRSTGDDNPFR